MKIIKYHKDSKQEWNNFLDRCKNKHFFFDRDFISYHDGRFEDFSLMIYHDNKLIALLPANIQNHTIYTHQGLTFGGVLYTNKMKLSIMIELFQTLKEYLLKKNITKLIYKSTPYIYHDKPSDDDTFALTQNKATLLQTRLSSVIDLTKPITYSNGRKHSLRKSSKLGFEIEKSNNFGTFWDILEQVLQTFHNSKPLHTKDEIQLLAKRFPKNIELFLVKKDGIIYAGAVAFVNQQTIKLQYVANFQDGRKLGALDFLIDYLIKEVYKDKRYFDFGTSLDSDGELNLGLTDQKERFGASGVLNQTFEWSLS